MEQNKKSKAGRKKLPEGSKKVRKDYTLSVKTRDLIDKEAEDKKTTASAIVDSYMPEIIKLKEEKK